MLKKNLALAILLGLTATGLQTARANHVDFMTDGEFNQVGNGTQAVPGPQSSILGGVRRVTVNDGGSGFPPSAFLPNNSTSIFFNAERAGSSLTLGYGTPFGGSAGDGGPGSFPSNFVNNAGPNWDSIVVSLAQVNSLGADTFNLSVSSGGSQFSFAPQLITGAGAYTFFYSEAMGSGIDFTAIDGVRLVLTVGGSQPRPADAPNGGAFSFQLSGITRQTSVPEPSSIALMIAGGLGGLVMLLRRRRCA